MQLSIKPKQYIIPEYSLTGDLLDYLTCGLRYRYYNKGSLPPSKPVRLWFGEFMQGVIEEAYPEWQYNDRRRFPWNWIPEIRDIEQRIDKRLNANGLHPPPKLFCRHDNSDRIQRLCSDSDHPHQLIASKRAEAAINTWGTHLFPLIKESKVRLKGQRRMPNYREESSRSNYYGITGIIDVVSFVNLRSVSSANLILHHIHKNPKIMDTISKLSAQEYEIIIDYKAMMRPPINDPQNPTWKHHEWQILTYAWLRSKQPRSMPIVGGILFYFDELFPLYAEMESLKDQVIRDKTDIMPEGPDLTAIEDRTQDKPLPNLSKTYRENRSIRVIPIDHSAIESSLRNFDEVIAEIEKSIFEESLGSPIRECWTLRQQERTCNLCDFKTFCPDPAWKYKTISS